MPVFTFCDRTAKLDCDFLNFSIVGEDNIVIKMVNVFIKSSSLMFLYCF